MTPRRNWDYPTPLPQASVPMPWTKGGAYSPAGGESKFRRLEKKLYLLYLLSAINSVCWTKENVADHILE